MCFVLRGWGPVYSPRSAERSALRIPREAPRCPSEPSSRTPGDARRPTGSVFACGPEQAERSWPVGAPRAARGCPGSRGAGTTRASSVRRVLVQGAAFRGRRVVVFLAPGSGGVAFVAGRRVGGAVSRNRARRILRAAWRQFAPGTGEEYDIALVARGTIRGAKTQDLVAEVNELLWRAGVAPP
jgi:ribonuclease P protein component